MLKKQQDVLEFQVLASRHCTIAMLFKVLWGTIDIIAHFLIIIQRDRFFNNSVLYLSYGRLKLV